MEEESILKKLKKLSKLRNLLKEKKIRKVKDKKLKYGHLNIEDDDEDDYDYDDDLLSHSELMEEALKEYMYQFGLSIYQNKQGDYYFKQFENNFDTRDFEELDTHHFALHEREPGFWEKIFEVIPENKIQLTDNMEKAVLDLYEKDSTMSDILDQMVANEMEKCREILLESEALDLNVNLPQQEKSFDKSYDERLSYSQSDNMPLAQKTEYTDLPVSESSNEASITSAVPQNKTLEVYACGENHLENVHLSKPTKVRRVKKQSAPSLAAVTKDNGNTR